MNIMSWCCNAPTYPSKNPRSDFRYCWACRRPINMVGYALKEDKSTEIGGGWKYIFVSDLYKFNTDEFMIDGSLVRTFKKSLPKNKKNIDMVDMLNMIYREAKRL